jgi:hypothetical protein
MGDVKAYGSRCPRSYHEFGHRASRHGASAIWACATDADAMKVDESPKLEPFGPCLDDGRLRDQSGNVVDPADESWWDRPWANDAAKLLGPEWVAGTTPETATRPWRVPVLVAGPHARQLLKAPKIYLVKKEQGPASQG